MHHLASKRQQQQQQHQEVPGPTLHPHQCHQHRQQQQRQQQQQVRQGQQADSGHVSESGDRNRLQNVRAEQVNTEVPWYEEQVSLVPVCTVHTHAATHREPIRKEAPESCYPTAFTIVNKPFHSYVKCNQASVWKRGEGWLWTQSDQELVSRTI